MDDNKLKILLEKYWSGKTSLEEEKLLQKFFSIENNREKFPNEAKWFLFKDYRQNIRLNKTLDIERVTGHKSPDQHHWNLGTFLKIAAAFAVVIASIFIVKNEVENDSTKEKMISDTFEDPKKAFEETKKVLMKLSRNFEKGEEKFEKLSEFHETKEKIAGNKENED